MSRRTLTIAVVILAVAALAGAAAWLGARSAPSSGVDLGGPFALVDQDGHPFTQRGLRGKPAAMFFGFTYCPEVCPATLARQTAALKALGPDADKLRVVFVSVDPERDTPKQMKAYLSDFDSRIIGLTGAPDAVARMLSAYHVYAKKIPVEGGGYTVDHMAATYLFDRKGGFQGLIGYGESPATELVKLRALANGRPPAS